jgi:carbonic anhydrase
MAQMEHRPTTPDDALAELMAGNERFVTGSRVHPHQDAERRTEIAGAQRPFAVVFGCSDSRLAAEIIFDRGLGDLFVIRTAGHVVGAEVLASIEYGITVLGAPLLVVLGHDSCGAIQATQDALAGTFQPGPGLLPLINRIKPVLAQAEAAGITDPDEISAAHVRSTVDQLTGEDPRLAEAVAAKECGVVGFTYRLNDGRVTIVAPATR